MMQRSRLKRIVVQGLVVLCVLGSVGALVLAGRISTWNSPTRSATVIPEVAQLPGTADRLVSWTKDRWRGVRGLEPATRVLVEAAYVRAWAALGRYQSTGAIEPVTNSFTGPARDAVLALPSGTAATWALAHRLTLTFYSQDGGTLAVEDTAADVVRSVAGGGSVVIADARETYQVIMVNRTGVWLVQQLRRTGSTTPAVVGGDGAGGVSVRVSPDARQADRTAVPRLTGTGYSLDAGAALDETAAAADLSTVRRLGLNTVRLRLPYTTLGADSPKADALRRVQRFLDLAHEQQVRVVPALFAGLPAPAPDGWAATDRHLRAVVTELKDHPAIVLWDLADRLDTPTAGSPGEVQTRAWVVHTITQMRRFAPRAPITVSWPDPRTGADAATNALLDVVSLAWTGDHTGLPGALAAVTRAASGRPVMLSRYGLDSYNGVMPGGHTEREQAYDLAQTRLIAERNSLHGVVFAALRDDPAEGHAGLIRDDGSPKPAAALAGTTTAGLRTVPAPSAAAEMLHKPFWWLVTASSLTAVAVAWLLLRRRRRVLAARAGAKAGTRTATESHTDRSPDDASMVTRR